MKRKRESGEQAAQTEQPSPIPVLYGDIYSLILDQMDDDREKLRVSLLSKRCKERVKMHFLQHGLKLIGVTVSWEKLLQWPLLKLVPSLTVRQLLLQSKFVSLEACERVQRLDLRLSLDNELYNSQITLVLPRCVQQAKLQSIYALVAVTDCTNVVGANFLAPSGFQASHSKRRKCSKDQ